MDSFKIINISSKAEQYFVNLLKDKAPETRVRVFVANPGTPGVECGILYCPKDMITGADDIFAYNGFDIVITYKYFIIDWDNCKNNVFLV